MTEQKSFGCAQCFQGEAEAMLKGKRQFVHLARLVDESHFDISVLACPACGQRCISIFTEMIDWEAGDDPQYVSVLPVTVEESEKLIASGYQAIEQIEALGRDRRYLQDDHPKGGPRRTFWATGELFIGPHD